MVVWVERLPIVQTAEIDSNSQLNKVVDFLLWWLSLEGRSRPGCSSWSCSAANCCHFLLLVYSYIVSVLKVSLTSRMACRTITLGYPSRVMSTPFRLPLFPPPPQLDPVVEECVDPLDPQLFNILGPGPREMVAGSAQRRHFPFNSGNGPRETKLGLPPRRIGQKN
jgi:hypothetical protein